MNLTDKASNQDFKKFGIILGAALLFWGFVFMLRQSPKSVFFLIAGTMMLSTGIFAPGVLYPLHKTFSAIGIAFSFLLTRVVLGVVFYLVVTPLGLIGRLFKHKFLDLEFDKAACTYWIKKEKHSSDKTAYEKQY